MNLKQAPLDEKVDLCVIANGTAGFSGADLAELAKRTREKVFSEAVHLGIFRPIDQGDLVKVRESMSPSINPREIILYEQFASSNSGLRNRK
jgi:SpoVK/Ycf46/Vps4 family AAA+-type ATPase